MSHVTTLKGIKFTDVQAIRQAVQELAQKGININLKENMKPRVHGFDAAPTCEFVVCLPSCDYDVGLKLNKEGEYEPVLDTYQNEVGSQIAGQCPVPPEYARRALHQMGQFGAAYQKQAAIIQAGNEGYIFDGESFNAETGETTLLFNVMS